MSKHRATHRRSRRRGRVAALVLAVGATVVTGGAAFGVLPQLKPAESAPADSSLPVALQTASLEVLDIPEPEPTPEPVVDEVPALPEGSGDGRRIVFDQSDQRVWLVGDDNAIERTYLVSGSRFNNLQPGSYTVQSKQRYATAFDYTGTMEYFVRFATGFSAPIGFHSVPVYNNGELEQTKDQLGQPLSAGCVRQWMPDAVALWDFAPIGTAVVVTA